MATVTMKGVNKRYPNGAHAIRGVDMEIDNGELVVFVGPSGCGKSTLLRMVAGLEEISEGQISIDGERINELSPADRDVAMVFQNYALYPHMKVFDNMAFSLKLAKVDPAKLKARVQSAAEILGLTEFLERYPRQLSGGQRQRVAIARAFAAEPELIVCDEPLSALDVSVQAAILNLLVDLQRNSRTAYMFISHDLSVVRYLADQVAVMYMGTLCEIGTPEQVFQPPYHPYTEALLSAVPIPDPRVRRDRIILQGDVPSPINPPSGCRFHTRCPYAEERCRIEEPELRDVQPGHAVACHLREVGAPPVNLSPTGA